MIGHSPLLEREIKIVPKYAFDFWATFKFSTRWRSFSNSSFFFFFFQNCGAKEAPVMCEWLYTFRKTLSFLGSSVFFPSKYGSKELPAICEWS